MKRHYLQILIVSLIGLNLIGCSGVGIFQFDGGVDGYYEGWVNIDRPAAGFDRSFSASLRIYDNSFSARMRDSFGRSFEAYRVEAGTWDRNLTIFFRVVETRWSPKCGYEKYDWSIRMDGRVLSDGRLNGDLMADIDPPDYRSEFCHMDFNPPPIYLGTFDFHRANEIW